MPPEDDTIIPEHVEPEPTSPVVDNSITETPVIPNREDDPILKEIKKIKRLRREANKLLKTQRAARSLITDETPEPVATQTTTRKKTGNWFVDGLLGIFEKD